MIWKTLFKVGRNILLMISVIGMLLSPVQACSFDAKDTLDSLVRIEIQQPDGSFAFNGSGTAVSDDYVVTARHVVDSEVARVCNMKNECSAPVTWKYVGTQDIAFGHLEGLDKMLDLKPVHLKKDLEIGQDVFIAGFPNNTPVVLDAQVIGQLSETLFLLNGYVDSGGSGGGVFSESGKLIGVVIAMPLDQTWMGDQVKVHQLVIVEKI